MRSILSKVLLSASLGLLLQPASAATVLVFGDSLSAGYGLSPGQGWVSLLAKEMGAKHRIINASISGETTAGGLAPPDALARHRPDIVVLELGANDGLRGLPLAQMRGNLSKMIALAKQSKARVLLVGMALPRTMARNTAPSSATPTPSWPSASACPSCRCWWPASRPICRSSSRTACIPSPPPSLR